MTLSENVISVNGLNVRYYEAGNPVYKTLLMLHGHLGDAWMHWHKSMPDLAKPFHTIAVDLPGYGQSDPLPTTNVNTIMQWVLDFIQAAELENIVVIGNSFGGLIARLLGANHPDAIDAVVLVNGGVIPAVPGIARFLARTPVIGGLLFNRIASSTSSKTAIEGLFEDKSLLTDETVNRVQGNRAGLARIMRALTTLEKPAKRTPRMPVMLFWGAEDAITPRVVGEQIHKHIPDSRFELVEGTRHVPHIEEHEVFVWQVTDFVTSIARAGEVNLLD